MDWCAWNNNNDNNKKKIMIIIIEERDEAKELSEILILSNRSGSEKEIREELHRFWHKCNR